MHSVLNSYLILSDMGLILQQIKIVNVETFTPPQANAIPARTRTDAVN